MSIRELQNYILGIKVTGYINSISNEKQYRAFLTTYNDDGTSSVSNTIVFWAISTPVVLGANYIQGLSYSSYNFIFNYSPGIGRKELLKSYNIKLYDENDFRNLIRH